MPFTWQKGKNPYLFYYYSRLQIGPNTPALQIIQKAQSLTQLLKAAEKDRSAACRDLDEHAVSEAARELRNPRAVAEELLLVHPQPAGEDSSKLKALVEQLRKRAAFAGERPAIPLREPQAILWFLPAPGCEAVPLPPCDELGLTGTNDPEDTCYWTSSLTFKEE
jgi:hypothetical protein